MDRRANPVGHGRVFKPNVLKRIGLTKIWPNKCPRCCGLCRRGEQIPRYALSCRKFRTLCSSGGFTEFPGQLGWTKTSAFPVFQEDLFLGWVVRSMFRFWRCGAGAHPHTGQGWSVPGNPCDISDDFKAQISGITQATLGPLTQDERAPRKPSVYTGLSNLIC